MNPHAEPVLVGESSAMVHLRALIDSAAKTRLPVLIEGPTGSGKELVAAALHARSGRTGRLVAFNVCAVSEAMFEDALFGHVRGAFTGAVADRPGFLREADRGTVFLDEIGGLPLPLQSKLLRAIETGEFRPVGGGHDVKSDARVVAATNEPIWGLVNGGRFRADLAHRLAGVVIHVPGMDERREDIPLLVAHFLARCGHGALRVSSGSMRRLLGHAWPGNVRELKQVVEWAAELADGAGELSEEAVSMALAYRMSDGAAREHVLAERGTLRQLLERHEWNTLAAADELGVNRATVYRYMKRLRVKTPTAIRTDSLAFARMHANERESRRGDAGPSAEDTMT
jgi:serine/threonine-protein kinase PknK